MITRIFWTLFTLETIAVMVLFFYAFGDLRGRRGWGPEGPVGGIVIIIPPIILLGVAALVLAAKSDRVTLIATVFLALPLIQMALGPVYTAFANWRVDRSLAGDDTFRRPAQRNLAHAIRAHDGAQVKALIPAAGDLNARFDGETLLRFAVINADGPGAPYDVVKALLLAGANPNTPSYTSDWPLTLAIGQSAELTEMLLKAGADPNKLDGAGRPLWWDALPNDTDDRLRTLKTLLAHGADLTKRDSEGGPVAWAAYHKNWRAVWLLMERGAEWKNEQAWGQPVAQMLSQDLSSREAGRTQIPEEMRKVAEKMLGNATPQ